MRAHLLFDLFVWSLCATAMFEFAFRIIDGEPPTFEQSLAGVVLMMIAREIATVILETEIAEEDDR